MAGISLEEFRARIMRSLIAEGVEFSKCANCGTTYPLVPESSNPEEVWTNRTVCGDRCSRAYIAYLNNPQEW